jgi:hypothetical protein
MNDFFNLGYSQLLSALALLGGFAGGATFFFANQSIRQDIRPLFQILYFLGFLLCMGGFVLIVYFFSANGSIFVEYSKTIHEDSPILINISCSDPTNCSTSYPAQLKISCQEKVCPPENICPNISCQPPPICHKISNWPAPLLLPKM